ncbi:MAG: hypothetical protein Q4C53_03090 [Clostridia bacterium]|nr:hypothetical protein [Clostridia bacterium]
MKKILAAGFALALALSCGALADAGDFAGVWSAKNGEDTVTVTLYDDERVTAISEGMVLDGVWSAEGNAATAQFEGAEVSMALNEDGTMHFVSPAFEADFGFVRPVPAPSALSGVWTTTSEEYADTTLRLYEDGTYLLEAADYDIVPGVWTFAGNGVVLYSDEKAEYVALANGKLIGSFGVELGYAEDFPKGTAHAGVWVSGETADGIAMLLCFHTDGNVIVVRDGAVVMNVPWTETANGVNFADTFEGTDTADGTLLVPVNGEQVVFSR